MGLPKDKINEVKDSIKILIDITGEINAAGAYALKFIDIIDDIVDNNLEQLNADLDYMILAPILAVYDVLVDRANIRKIERQPYEDIIQFKKRIVAHIGDIRNDRSHRN